jgi:deoxyribonuclease V
VDHAADPAALIEHQRALGAASPAPWRPPAGATLAIAGCFCCFERGAGVRAWAAAALGQDVAVVEAEVFAPYEPGLLALRELEPLERAVRALGVRPDVVLVNATGRDHPRRAGLALHLGAVLDLPSVGVTHRPLYAAGDWPAPQAGARSPLLLDGEEVGAWLRVRRRARPLAVHAAWRTDADAAVGVVLAVSARVRTPAPLRAARRAARCARSRAGG